MQRLRGVTYWLQGGQLMRAERFAADGSLAGVAIADGVDSLRVSLLFTDGHEERAADPTDASATTTTTTW